MSEKQGPFSQLTDAQKLRLANLQADIGYDKITVSFLLESRENYAKKSAFYSASAVPQDGKPWRIDDLKVVRALVCKHVVAGCYTDAVKRRMMTEGQAHEEATAILASYDAQIVKSLTNGEER